MRPRQRPERIAWNRGGRVVSNEVEQRVHRERMNSLGRQPRATLGAIDGVGSVDFLAAAAAPLGSPGARGQEHRHSHHAQHNEVPFIKTRCDSRHADKHGVFPLEPIPLTLLAPVFNRWHRSSTGGAGLQPVKSTSYKPVPHYWDRLSVTWNIQRRTTNTGAVPPPPNE